MFEILIARRELSSPVPTTIIALKPTAFARSIADPRSFL
jgi:hypothetical protein